MIKFDGKSNRLKVRRQDVLPDVVTVSMRVDETGRVVGESRSADGAVSAVKSYLRLSAPSTSKEQHQFRNDTMRSRTLGEER